MSAFSSIDANFLNYATRKKFLISQATVFADGDQERLHIYVHASPTHFQAFQYYTKISCVRATKRGDPYEKQQQMYGRIYLTYL